MIITYRGTGGSKPVIALENPFLSGMRASGSAGHKSIEIQNTGVVDGKALDIAAHTSLKVAQACKEKHRKDRLSASMF
jgi:hypothetical protein